jgi:hypothetical protein
MTSAEKKQIDEQGLKWNKTLHTVLKELQDLQKETKQTHITDVMPDLTVIYGPNSDVCRWS